MVDVLGWRKVFAVLGPSTNTIVQPDMEAMRPAGVTNQYRDIYVENPSALSDADFMAGAGKIAEGFKDALRTAMTMGPDYLVLGVSAIAFIGGAQACDRFVTEVNDFTGLDISVGSISCVEALKAYSPNIKRIAFVSPYYPAANAHVRRFFEDYGYEVVRDVCLRCTSWRDIAQQGEARLRGVLKDLDGDDIDAIVQVGTNLSMVRLAAQAEVWLEKPVIAINAATYWHALRANGIADKIDGLGKLLAEK
ncbi:hypothetical protein [Phenylobacterium aquaticum]|uniref:maleate cis-trans isomerase family protein n=1 Tax=Phenylobacterium aquaticum TaxID=1763816 RepID=UPI0026EAB955|nr:hypothetical protein [Phenylobacterium aquaticum]